MLTHYKELNVYKRAYKVAIELHNFPSQKGQKISPDQARKLNNLTRDILGNIAEGASARGPKARRYMNFKARDGAHRLLMDFEFLHDIGSLSDEDYDKFSKEFDICSAMLWKLNQSILDRQNEAKEASEEKVAA